MKLGHGKRHGRDRRSEHRPPAGARPGTLMIHESAPKPVLRVMHYAGEDLEERELEGPDEVEAFLADDGITWLDVQGHGDEATLLRLGELFAIHPLALEDVVHVRQRPKTEPYEENVLSITRMVQLDENGDLATEQVSLFLGDRYVVTFQEREGDVLEPVRRRLRDARGLMRRSGPDYLAYTILDAIVDGFFPVMERLGDELEVLEERVLEDPDPELIALLNGSKRRLLELRRYVWPQREAIATLMRETDGHVDDRVRVYLRDTYDHCVQAADVLETYRDLNSGLLNTYLTIVANRTNDVMKVLTIIATIFIPLTFLAGVYGMNFEHMPELGWRWSYGIFWIVSLVLGAALFALFKRKGWIGRP